MTQPCISLWCNWQHNGFWCRYLRFESLRGSLIPDGLLAGRSRSDRELRWFDSSSGSDEVCCKFVLGVVGMNLTGHGLILGSRVVHIGQ